MSESPAVPAPPPSSSRWEDLIDVFISPAELFRRRSDGKFGLALLALIILFGIVFFGTRTAIQPIMDAEFQRQMASRPNITPEQLEAGRRIAHTFAPIALLIGLAITAFILGAVLWLTARVVGGRMSYAQGATVATFSYFPKVVEAIANGVQALVMDESKLTSLHSVKLGITRFLDPGTTNAVLLALLGRVDLFTLWVTILIAVGLKQIARTTTGQAVAGAALVWLIGALPTLLQALRAG